MEKQKNQQAIADASMAATMDNETIVYINEQTGEANVVYNLLLKRESKRAKTPMELRKESAALLVKLFEDELQLRIMSVFDVTTRREYYLEIVTTAWLKKMQDIEDIEDLFANSMNGTQNDVAYYGDAFCKEQACHDIPGEGDEKIETTTFVRFFPDTPAQIVERSIKQMNHIMKCLDLIGDNVVYLIPKNYENCIKTAEDLKGSKAVTLNNGYVYIR